MTRVGDRTDGHRQISITSVGVGGFNVWSVYIERVQCVVGVGVNTRGMMCVKSEEREKERVRKNEREERKKNER